jgi:Heterokaryon incompatibility protein (HET)
MANLLVLWAVHNSSHDVLSMVSQEYVFMASVPIVAIWFLLPKSWRSNFLGEVGYFIVSSFFRYNLNFRGVFLWVYEAVVCPFDRWGTAVARQRLKRRSCSMEVYRYSKLDSPQHFRILRLKRRSFFTAPSCELVQVCLDEAPPFEAISYTWGDKEPDIPLEVDGFQILVTSAVDQLLFYQRSVFGSKAFWIDAVCINQSDISEKNLQLPLMTEIYRSSTRVVVWLGPPKSTENTRIIRKIVRELSSVSFYKACGMGIDSLLQIFFHDEEIAFITLSELFKHSWFE